MKGHMQDGKFHPHTEYKKGTRKSRDQKAKQDGVKIERKKRYNVCDPFLEDPASHKPDDAKHTNQIMYSLGDESCASVLTDEEFSMLLTDNQVANTFSPIGDTATKWQQDDAFRKRIIDRAQELIEEQKQGERNKRDPHIKGKKLPKEVVQGAKDDLGGTDVEVESYNPKWKLYEVYVDSDRYYFFPDEESAIKFGRQSIRDTASEYIPDEGSPQRAEYINLSDDDLVEKIIEEQSDYGQRSELGAVAQSVASADGQYHEFANGWIAFQID